MYSFVISAFKRLPIVEQGPYLVRSLLLTKLPLGLAANLTTCDHSQVIEVEGLAPGIQFPTVSFGLTLQ